MRRTSDPDLLLLDTHVWLWLVAGSPELSTEARNMIDRAVAGGSSDCGELALGDRIAGLAWSHHSEQVDRFVA
jgi:hypothetical protein